MSVRCDSPNNSSSIQSPPSTSRRSKSDQVSAPTRRSTTDNSSSPFLLDDIGLSSNNAPNIIHTQSNSSKHSHNSRDRRLGHLRGTRSNGFASAPPFPKNVRLEEFRNRCEHVDEFDPFTAALKDRQKQHQMALIEQELDVMAKETQCGIGKWRPLWLQGLATRYWMIFWLCWFCTVQGMIVNGLFPSSISTIERRFQFSTSTIGRILQFYDFGYVIFCIPVSYFGGRHSKPLVISAGLFFMALGSLLFTTPHFIADSYTSSYHTSNEDYSKCYAQAKIELLNVAKFANNNETSKIPPSLAPLLHRETKYQDDLISALNGARFDASCQSPENQPGTFHFVFIFCLAHFMHGVGATPLFTIAVSYIDENVGPAISSLFIGVFYAFAIFGPAIGFFASSKFLLWHTDWMHTGQKLQKLIIDLEETDPKWVGAWYMGFFVACIAGLVAVFPIVMLPKVLPESLKWHRTRLREATLGEKTKRSPECCGLPPSKKASLVRRSRNNANDGTNLDEKGDVMPVSDSLLPPISIPRSSVIRSGPLLYQLWLDIRHIPIAIARILLNGPYMLITFGMAIDGLIVTGCSTFMAKYLERQFGVAPSKANLFIGAIMVPFAGLGTIFSGIIIHKYRMSPQRTLQYCIALVLCSLLLSPMYLIYCDHDRLVGLERHYPVADDLSNHYDPVSQSYTYHLDAKCNQHCQCNPSEYHPVCSELTDGSQMSFYSPCFAGCPEQYSPSIRSYTNCSCVPDGTKGGFRRVKKGFCESKCRGLLAFMILFAPFCFVTFAVGVALIFVVLRTVEHEERSFALGIQWILVRVIGTIPAPMVFSWLFDFSCVRRHLDPCFREGGNCLLYHNKSLADLFLAFSVAGQLVALICLICVMMFFVSSLRDDPLPDRAADAPPDNVIRSDEFLNTDDFNNPLHIDVECSNEEQEGKCTDMIGARKGRKKIKFLVGPLLNIGSPTKRNSPNNKYSTNAEMTIELEPMLSNEASVKSTTDGQQKSNDSGQFPIPSSTNINHEHPSSTGAIASSTGGRFLSHYI